MLSAFASGRVPLATRLRAGAVLCAAFLLTSCAGAVSLEAPAPDAAAATICAAVLSDVPATVLGTSRRETTVPALSAAWGDPPITLRCGVVAPPALRKDSECLEVDGIGWFSEPAEGGTLFTTIGRAAYVEIGVPTAYEPQASALVDVAEAINENNPVLQPCA